MSFSLDPSKAQASGTNVPNPGATLSFGTPLGTAPSKKKTF